MQDNSLALLLVTPLGDNNRGTIGPKGETAEENARLTQQVAETIAQSEYSKRPTNEWWCVDGRVTAEMMAATEPSDEAHPQTAGGLPLTDLAGEYMMNSNPAPVSVVLVEKTKEAIQNGQVPAIHGADGPDGKAGCGCNKGQREIMRENAANIDIVTPIAWEVGKTVGLDEHLTVEDVTNLITLGGENAEKDELWDITPEEKVDLIVANGGKYVPLTGAHQEYVTRIDITENAFDEAQFIRDNIMAHGEPIMGFNVSLGLLKKYYFEHNADQRVAALKTMAAILHNGGTAKLLSNEHMQAAIVGTVS